MMRDAYTDFALSEGLREAIADALEEREHRAELSRLRGLLRFWERQGRPLLFFYLERDSRGVLIEMHQTRRSYWLPYVMRGSSND